MPLLKHVGKITSARLAPGDGNQTKLILTYAITLKSEVGFSAVPMIAKLTGQSVYMSVYGDQLEFPYSDEDAERMAKQAMAKENGKNNDEPELDLEDKDDETE
jgi:hypothetical protein